MASNLQSSSVDLAENEMSEYKTDSASEHSDMEDTNDDIAQPGCQHYARLCKLKAVCCSQIYWCRFCHDEQNTHEMNRHLVQEVQCSICELVQAVSDKCMKCSIVFGKYYCLVCRLYDKDKGQYHCDKCGICRVGPKDQFFHCDTCNTCLAKNLIGKHKCVENVSQSVCPICQEFLHTSRQELSIPKCGHMIHRECLNSYYQQGLYQCPMCKESMVDMSSVWAQMDNACASVVLPEDLKNMVLNILCQDCHQKSDVPFNTEGLKCPKCGSYNTTQT